MVAAVKGYKLILVMPESMSIERRRLMLAYGASFDLTPREKGMKGAIERALRADRGDARALDAAAVRESRQHRRAMSAPPRRRSWPTSRHADRRAHHRRRHRRAHHRRAREVLKKQWPKLKVFAVEPTRRRSSRAAQPAPHPIQGIGAGFIPANLDTQPARRRDPGRRRTTPRRWRAARRARRACWSASPRARRWPRSRRNCRPAGRLARARLQLRHRRALSVGAGLPEHLTSVIR